MLRDAALSALKNNFLQKDSLFPDSPRNLHAKVVKKLVRNLSPVKVLDLLIQIPLPCFYTVYIKSQVSSWKICVATMDLIMLHPFILAGNFFFNVVLLLFVIIHFRHQKNSKKYPTNPNL